MHLATHVLIGRRDRIVCIFGHKTRDRSLNEENRSGEGSALVSSAIVATTRLSRRLCTASEFSKAVALRAIDRPRFIDHLKEASTFVVSRLLTGFSVHKLIWDNESIGT